MMYQRKREEAEARRGSGPPAINGPLTAGSVAGRLRNRGEQHRCRYWWRLSVRAGLGVLHDLKSLRLPPQPLWWGRRWQLD